MEIKLGRAYKPHSLIQTLGRLHHIGGVQSQNRGSGCACSVDTFFHQCSTDALTPAGRCHSQQTHFRLRARDRSAIRHRPHHPGWKQ